MKSKKRNYEFGTYLGCNQQFFGETLLLNATARIDKNQNFDYLFSPAASLVYQPNERDIIRVSLSSAIRNPTLTDQYLDYNAGPATLIGNINGFGYNEYFVTIDAMLECLAAENSSLGNADGAALKYGKLEIDPIKPEQVKTIELGLRTTLFNQLYLDASYYYSLYNNFIGYQSAQNPLSNDKYWPKCGMILDGDKIGTYVGAIWVVHGHFAICIKNALFCYIFALICRN